MIWIFDEELGFISQRLDTIEEYLKMPNLGIFFIIKKGYKYLASNKKHNESTRWVDWNDSWAAPIFYADYAKASLDQTKFGGDIIKLQIGEPK